VGFDPTKLRIIRILGQKRQRLPKGNSFDPARQAGGSMV